MIWRDDGAGRRLPADRQGAYAILMVAVVLLSGAYQPLRANPPEAAYLLVLREAIKLPPAPLRSFLLQHHPQLQRELSAQVFADDVNLPTSLDCSAFRVAPASEITESPTPVDRAALKKRLGRRGITTSGDLLECALDRCEQLADAFRAEDEDHLVVHFASLVRVLTDGCFAFCPNGDVVCTGDPGGNFADMKRSRAMAPHLRLRDRVLHQLVVRHRARFDWEVRVHGKRFQRVKRALPEVWAYLADAHEAADKLARWDRRCMERLRVRNAHAFLDNVDAYYDDMARRGGGLVRTRLEAAALTAAQLGDWAWVQGGSKDLPIGAGEARVEESSGVEQSTGIEQPAGSFVGSRNSTIYHKNDCAHARRIKRENTIRFESADNARRLGRTPCRTCRPQ